MKNVQIYHNPRCRKSRETLDILQKKNIDPEIILYLESPPSKSRLKQIVKMLGIKAEDLVRKGESIYKDNYKGKTLTQDEWIAAMVENPKLIERPIVIKNEKAALGRPPENVLDIL